ncbi:MAG: hypothetical protein ACI3YT_06870 [Prevotella sp.]
MALNLKAKESLIQIGKFAGTYRYVLSPIIYNKLSEDKVIEEACVRSNLAKSVLQSAWNSIGDVIKAWATEGHSVAIPGLGTMRFGINATSVSSVDKVSYGLITARKVIFTPSKKIKTELINTGISIACYNRDGKLIRTVNTSNENVGDFELELISSPENAGTFEGAGFYNDGDVALVKAIPAEGYVFVKWNDDETSPERSITISDDVSYVATFKKTAASEGTGSGNSGNSGTSGDNTGTSGDNTGTSGDNTGGEGEDLPPVIGGDENGGEGGDEVIDDGDLSN